MNNVLELIKLIVPAAIVLYGIYLVIQSFIRRELDMKKLDIRGRSMETILPLRMQAYERITLFLERIAAQNILVRLNTTGISARDFQRLLLEEVRNEYNHNASQQIFMSDGLWNQIRHAKDDFVMMINEASEMLPPQANSIDLSKQIFELSLQRNIDLNMVALKSLKDEIQQLF